MLRRYAQWFKKDQADEFFKDIRFSDFELSICKRILEEIQKRLRYLVDVGLGYITLDRLSSSLSGGESQRINLATSIGSSLVGSIYVLDEPSIGLHPLDNDRLIRILKSLRDIGNTVLVVEHDADMMAESDLLVDMGPRAGEHGGEVTFFGTHAEMLAAPNSLTGKYLSGRLSIPVPQNRRKKGTLSLRIINAFLHNLKNIDVEIPLNMFTCITGVSGSGKSTLVHEVLYEGLKKKLLSLSGSVFGAASVEGFEHSAFKSYYLHQSIRIDTRPSCRNAGGKDSWLWARIFFLQRAGRTMRNVRGRWAAKN